MSGDLAKLLSDLKEQEVLTFLDKALGKEVDAMAAVHLAKGWIGG